MNLNFFSWIREGVRQAVLHGVSDAVDHLGPAAHDAEMSQRVQKAIEQSPHYALATEGKTAVADEPHPARRRKLGRSLDQIVSERHDSGDKSHDHR